MNASYDSVEYMRNSRPPRIRFGISITNDSGQRSRFFGFCGQLRLVLKNTDPLIADVDSIILNDIIDSENQVLDIDHDKSRQLDLTFILDPYLKNIIENNREGDLRFRIYLYCYRFSNIEQNPQIVSENCHVSSRHGIDIEIPRSKWADILSEAGYDKYQLIEIPIDYGDIINYSKTLEGDGFQDRIRKASDQLTRIMREMDEGNWRKAVGDCRIALDALILGDVKIVDGRKISVVNAISELLSTSGFPEETITSFNILLKQIKTFTSTQHHIKSEAGKEIELPVPMDREDALFAVTTVATIINLLSRKFARTHGLT